MKTRDVLAVFNRGRISPNAMARQDVSRVTLSADIQTNWMPRTLGSMSLRPGFEYHDSFGINEGICVPFVFSSSDTALIELSTSGSGIMRVWNDGDTKVTRPAVTTTISNEEFTTNLTGWTDDDDSGAASTWATGGYMQLLGTKTAAAKRYQQVTVSGGNVGVVHGLRITIESGPVILRVGSTAGDDDVFRQAVLRTGVHSIAFQADADFYVEFSSELDYPVLVDSCEIESSGNMSIPTPWTTIAACKSVRWQQSGDVVFIASDGYQQRRIERRPNDSWSLVIYEPEDGPYLVENTGRITISSSALSGQVTLTASDNLFKSGHVGGLFKMDSQGQTVEADLSADLTYTDPIRVTGVAGGRLFKVIRAGTWSGTLSLQQSIGDLGLWSQVATYTTNGTSQYNDSSGTDVLDNQIVYYRLGFEAGDYTSGTAEVSLVYDAGSITGVARITAVASGTSATANILKNLGDTDATDRWAEGAWSEKEGWPTAVALWEGRMWWSGSGRNYASVSDAFESYDPDYEGDAGPINRLTGDGAIERVNWLMPLQRMIAGTDGAEYSIRSNSFDEPVTPSNYNSKSPTTKGSHQAPPAIADGRGYFIDYTTKRIFELAYEGEKYDYGGLDLTLLVPEIGDETFSRIAIQKAPDFRLHCVRADGTAAVLVRDPAEDVICWVDVETDGDIQDVCVLPGSTGDKVFYRVKRVIGGTTYYYNEEWADGTDCIGGTLNLQADSFITGTGAVSGLSHLEGETVVIWADGEYQGTGTVASGAVSGHTYTSWVAGLAYDATYKSAKLAASLPDGLSLTQRARIDSIGLILVNTHAQGLQYGPSLTVLDDLPIVEDGTDTDGDYIWSQYDKDMITFPGEWSTDSRVCLKASAPKPCTVSAAVIRVDRQTHS